MYDCEVEIDAGIHRTFAGPPWSSIFLSSSLLLPRQMIKSIT
jgi:hypothetical protein